MADSPALRGLLGFGRSLIAKITEATPALLLAGLFFVWWRAMRPISPNDVIAAHEALKPENLQLEDLGIGGIVYWTISARCSAHGSLASFRSTLGDIPQDTYLLCPLHPGATHSCPVQSVERIQKHEEK